LSWTGTPDKHYVYIYRDLSGVPYYVGIGKGRRAIEKHLYAETPPKNRIEIVKESLTEQQAWDIEIELIQHYGRGNLNEAPLKTLTKGGAGAKSGWNQTQQAKDKISKALTGRKIADTSKYLGTLTEDHKEKIRQARLGTKSSQAEKNKISENMKQRIK